MCEITYIAPLYLYSEGGMVGETWTANIDANSYERLTQYMLEKPSPIEVFDYVYGILHDPVYCDKYEQYLCRDFPRVPVINDKNMMDEQDGFFVSEKLFREYVSVGEQLRKLHLLQVKVSADIAIEPNTAEDMIIESVKYKNGVLHINKNKRLLGISPSVWKYQIGGYQVLDKWFKEHKGEALSVMVKHFCNIYGSKNAEWLSLVYWDCLVYPAIRASYGVRYPL